MEKEKKVEHKRKDRPGSWSVTIDYIRVYCTATLYDQCYREYHELHDGGDPNNGYKTWTKSSWKAAAAAFSELNGHWGVEDHGNAQRFLKRPAASNRSKKPGVRTCEAIAEGTSGDVIPAPSLCMNRNEGAAASTVQKIDARMDHLIEWTCAIPVAATNVSDVSQALKTFDGADFLLESLGFSPFCRVLALRFVRSFGLAQGHPTYIDLVLTLIDSATSWWVQVLLMTSLQTFIA